MAESQFGKGGMYEPQNWRIFIILLYEEFGRFLGLIFGRVFNSIESPPSCAAFFNLGTSTNCALFPKIPKSQQLGAFFTMHGVQKFVTMVTSVFSDRQLQRGRILGETRREHSNTCGLVPKVVVVLPSSSLS